MTKASICTIGDEILIGQIVDTNSSLISRALGSHGIQTARMVSLPDDREQIISLLSRELSDCEIVICTGGLGPTKDDMTKDALAELSGSKGYVRNAEQEVIIREFLHARGLDVLPANLRQAMVPDSCKVILNRRGTAPIMVFPFPEERFGHPAVLYSLPGVPFEAEAALPEVLDDITARFPVSPIRHCTLMTYGLAESALSALIAPWEDALPEGMHLAYLPNPLTGVRLRISVYGGDEKEQEKLIDRQVELLKPYLGDNLYALQDTTLEAVIGDLLRGTGRTLATAESCTGGMIAHLITTVSGSSEYFLGSMVSYAPAVKCKVLGVNPATIESKGIVSSEVAAEMAEGVRRVTGATYSVATTGWADTYGDEREPAGTVWVGVSGPSGTVTKRFNYHNDRKRNIERFAASALDQLRRFIEKDCRSGRQ